MLNQYIEKALERAEYKRLGDRSWFAEISGFTGVWANAPTVEICRKELVEVLEEWVLLKLRDKDPGSLSYQLANDSQFRFARQGCRLQSKTGGRREFTTKSTKDTKNGIR